MPDVAANSLSIAFGDFRRGYLIVDRAGVRVLRDPFTTLHPVLHDKARRRQCAGFRRDQAAEVRGALQSRGRI
jgi:HK97 family phage major capsid protein